MIKSIIIGLALFVGFTAGWLYAGGLQQAVDRATDPSSPYIQE